MIKNEIGESAGKIWETLNEKGELSIEELKSLTELTEKQLLMAIGWLAREDKIFQINPYEKDWKICPVYN